MKKFISAIILLGTVLLTAFGCEKYPYDDIPDTSSTDAGTPEQTSSTETSIWGPWQHLAYNYTPDLHYGSDRVPIEDYDIELQLEADTFPASVTQITCTAVNKTGKGFLYSAMMLERYYPAGIFFPYIDETPGAWVRVPYSYYVPGSYSHSAVLKETFTTDLFLEGASLEPGKYRFVWFFGDGPHYVYFEITE